MDDLSASFARIGVFGARFPSVAVVLMSDFRFEAQEPHRTSPLLTVRLGRKAALFVNIKMCVFVKDRVPHSNGRRQQRFA